MLKAAGPIDLDTPATMQEVASISTDVCMGKGNGDIVIYYAENTDTTRAALIGLDPNTDGYFSYIGACEEPRENMMVITDDATGKSTGCITLEGVNHHCFRDDLGGDIGEVKSISCDIVEPVTAMNIINERGVPSNVAVGVEGA